MRRISGSKRFIQSFWVNCKGHTLLHRTKLLKILFLEVIRWCFLKKYRIGVLETINCYSSVIIFLTLATSWGIYFSVP